MGTIEGLLLCQSDPDKALTPTQGKDEVPPRGPSVVATAPALPRSHGVSTGTSKRYGMRKTQRDSHSGTVSDHAECFVAGSAHLMLQTGERRWVDWTQAITAEPTLGAFPHSLCSSVSLSCIYNYFKKCTEFGLKINHQNGSQHRSKAQRRSIGLI